VSSQPAPTPTLPHKRGRETSDKGKEISSEARVWSALAEINDPEMPINLVDLGVVYGVELAGGTVRGPG
jgi:metal-sulfur cluster biosynthetic enzyme